MKKSITLAGGSGFWTPNCTIIENPAFSIASLFKNGEQGFYYDPDDMSTMFQDSLGTIPVTAVGQPVGLIKDKSGRGNHAFQATSASRPILRKDVTTGSNYLEFDGVDDGYVTGNVDFSDTNKVTVACVVNPVDKTEQGTIVELSESANPPNIGSFGVYAPLTVGTKGFGAKIFGGANQSVASVNSLMPSKAVLVYRAQTGSVLNTLRVNGSLYASNGTATSGNLGNYPIYIGRRGGVYGAFNGRVYALLGISKILDDSIVNKVEKELAKRNEVTL